MVLLHRFHCTYVCKHTHLGYGHFLHHFLFHFPFLYFLHLIGDVPLHLLLFNHFVILLRREWGHSSFLWGNRTGIMQCSLSSLKRASSEHTVTPGLSETGLSKNLINPKKAYPKTSFTRNRFIRKPQSSETGLSENLIQPKQVYLKTSFICHSPVNHHH